MNYILELQVSITLSKDNPSYVLHHVEPISLGEKPSNEEIAGMIEVEYEFICDLLGFKPYCIAIKGDDVGTTFFS